MNNKIFGKIQLAFSSIIRLKYGHFRIYSIFQYQTYLQKKKKKKTCKCNKL